PREHEERVAIIFRRSREKVAGWFGARILASLYVGAVAFLIFLLLGAHYAFILALLAGVLNFIPFVGPAVVLVIAAVSIGVTDSWILALYAVIALLIIQESENKLLTPMLMKKFMNIPPVLVLLALLVGGTLFGFLGMIFMIPVVGIAYEFIKEFLEKRKEGTFPTAVLAEPPQ
ncbi:MAG: AI-2E family transporter, partial [Candidatus Saccharimonadales bacterium]